MKLARVTNLTISDLKSQDLLLSELPGGQVRGQEVDDDLVQGLTNRVRMIAHLLVVVGHFQTDADVNYRLYLEQWPYRTEFTAQ